MHSHTKRKREEEHSQPLNKQARTYFESDEFNFLFNPFFEPVKFQLAKKTLLPINKTKNAISAEEELSPAVRKIKDIVDANPDLLISILINLTSIGSFLKDILDNKRTIDEILKCTQRNPAIYSRLVMLRNKFKDEICQLMLKESRILDEILAYLPKWETIFSQLETLRGIERSETILGYATIYATVEQFHKVADILGEKKLIELAFIPVDNNSQLPIEYESHGVSSRTLLLEKVTLNNKEKIKPLNKELDIDETLLNFKDQIKLNPRLAELLYYACRAVNYARSIIKEATTHPDVALLTGEEVANLFDKRDSLRSNYDEKCCQKYNDDASVIKDLALYEELIKKYGFGNCGEIVAVIYYYLFRTDVKIEIQPWITDAHMWLVIGDNLNPNDSTKCPNVVENFGNNCIIIDGLFGNVFPGSLFKKLWRDCIPYDRADGTREIIPVPFCNHRLNITGVMGDDDMQISKALFQSDRKNTMCQTYRNFIFTRQQAGVSIFLPSNSLIQPSTTKNEPAPTRHQPWA